MSGYRHKELAQKDGVWDPYMLSKKCEMLTTEVYLKNIKLNNVSKLNRDLCNYYAK